MLEQSLLLWLPTEKIEDQELIEKITIANGAILDFCDGVLDLPNTLEVIDYCGADVDNYLSQLEDDLIFLGA